MNQLTAKNEVRVKGTAELTFPVLTGNDPVARLERRIKAFMANADWIYDTLALIEKLLVSDFTFSKLETLAMDRLDLQLEENEGKIIIKDRYHTEITEETLKKVKNITISLASAYAGKILKTPKLHHMEKSFKKTLRKVSRKELTDEERNILKEAYLFVENGRVYNLKGNEVEVPRYNFLRLLPSIN